MDLKSFFYMNLKQFLKQDSIDYTLLTTDQHKALYKMSAAHGVNLFIYDGFKNSNIATIDPKLMGKWKTKFLKKTLKQEKNLKVAKDMFKVFNENNIDVMILKGIAYSRYYKNPVCRSMGDYDLYVKSDDVIKLGQLLETFGYKKKDDGGVKSHHLIYKHEEFLTIELHTELFSEKKFPELSKLSLDMLENTKTTEFKKIKYRSPTAENEVLYCLGHMYKHYYDVGFGFKQICDVYQIIQSNEIKWDYVFKQLESYKIKSFSLVILNLMDEFFGLKFPKEIAALVEGIDIEIMTLFRDDIYSSGAFGFHDKTKYLSNHIADHRLETKVGKSKINHYRKFLFPNREFMLGYKDYQYCKPYKFLLPIAWGQRIILNIKKGHLKKSYIDQSLINKRLILKNWIID